MSTFDPTKPFKTRAGNTVEIITVKGRGERALIGHLGSEDEIRIWYINGRYFQHRESEYDLVNVKPWSLQDPPEGKQWHRDDGWTEEMLPRGFRPLLLGETGSYQVLTNEGWEEGGWPERPTTPESSVFFRTNRPLPSEPKMAPLTFEHVSKFVGVELRVTVRHIFSLSHMNERGVSIAGGGTFTWETLQRDAWQWRSVQNPEWQPCEMEELL